MSDNPNALKAVLLEDASDDQKKQFAEMLAQQCAEHDRQARKNELDWMFIPTSAEFERIQAAKTPDEKCPKCGKGRLVLTVFHGNIGDSVHVACKWGAPNCGYKVYVSDDDF